ncbi:PorV/PorQ family protein [bacterium]|nr:PorV/PorQ family protein [bacterium]
MRKSFLISVFLFHISGFLFAGGGETGFAFLKIGIGGKAAGMGETATATATDATASFWNPAGLIQSENHSVIFTYNRWIDGIQHNFGAAKFVYGNNAFALQYISTGVEDIEQRDIPSENPTAYFSSHDLALGLSYARKMNERLSVGITSKYIYERIQSSVSAFAFDFGAWYRIKYSSNADLDDRWRAGLMISNIGYSGKFIDEKVKLPASMRVGSSYDILKNPASKNTLSVAVDVEKFFAESIRTHVGMEYGYEDRCFVRGGYQLGYKARGISAGIGMKVQSISVDYGYMPFSNSLGATHRISIALGFQ